MREKLPLKTPPSTKQLQSRKKPFTPLPDIAEDDGDLVLVDSDEDEAARKATLFTEDQLQLFGADSQSQLVAPTAPVVCNPLPLSCLQTQSEDDANAYCQGICMTECFIQSGAKGSSTNESAVLVQVGQRPSGLSAKMPPRKGLLSFMKHGPMEDTQVHGTLEAHSRSAVQVAAVQCRTCTSANGYKMCCSSDHA